MLNLPCRRIAGWSIDKRMTQALVSRAMIKVINLRQPKRGLVFHSDRGSQYASRHYRKLLEDYIRYYNNDRLYTANNSLSPVNYELSERKVSGLSLIHI